MRETIAKSFGRTPYYLVAAVLQHLGGLLLLPVLIATLSSEEFTRYGLMTSSFHLLVPILTLNLHLAPGRLYFDCQDSVSQARLLLTTLVTACGLTAAGLVLTVSALQLSGYREPICLGAWQLQLLLATTILSIVVVEFGKLLMKVKGDARLYALAAPAQNFGLLVLLLAFRPLPLTGLSRVLLAYGLGFGVIALGMLWYSKSHLRQGSLARSDLNAAFAYSWPTVIHLVALWAVSSGGRWIGAFYVSLEAMAPFTLLTVLVTVIGLLARALFEARLPEIGSAFGSGRYLEGAAMVGSTTLVALAGVVVTYAGCYGLLFHLQLELPTGYQPTPTLLGFAAVASFLDGVYLAGIQILHALKKTRVQASATVCSGVLTVLLSLLWVRLFAVNGLMMALIAGLGVQAISSNLLARYHLRRALGTDQG